MSNLLQNTVIHARRIIPRGWSPLLSSIARFIPSLQQYRAHLANGDSIYLDLRESMCLGIFYTGGQAYELGTEKLFSKVLKPGDVVVDVGANVGLYTRLASRLVGAGGCVLAFEPNPVAFRILTLNSADLSNVSLFPNAVSDQEGEATFYVRKHGEMSSLGQDANATAVHVATITLDNSLANQPRVDFIKIDVEGFELEVLRGATKTLSTFRPIVYFELLQLYAQERGFGFEDFASLFGKYDYALKWVDHSGTESALVSDTPYEPGNVIAVPNEHMHLLQ